MEATSMLERRIHVSDTSGQKTAQVNFVNPDSTVGELVDDLVNELSLARTDVAGRPLTYHALSEELGRHLHASERVADAVQTGAHIVLAPNVVAGGRRP